MNEDFASFRHITGSDRNSNFITLKIKRGTCFPVWPASIRDVIQFPWQHVGQHLHEKQRGEKKKKEKRLDSITIPRNKHCEEMHTLKEAEPFNLSPCHMNSRCFVLRNSSFNSRCARLITIPACFHVSMYYVFHLSMYSV